MRRVTGPAVAGLVLLLAVACGRANGAGPFAAGSSAGTVLRADGLTGVPFGASPNAVRALISSILSARTGEPEASAYEESCPSAGPAGLRLTWALFSANFGGPDQSSLRFLGWSYDAIEDPAVTDGEDGMLRTERGAGIGTSGDQLRSTYGRAATDVPEYVGERMLIRTGASDRSILAFLDPQQIVRSMSAYDPTCQTQA